MHQAAVASTNTGLPAARRDANFSGVKLSALLAVGATAVVPGIRASPYAPASSTRSAPIAPSRRPRDSRLRVTLQSQAANATATAAASRNTTPFGPVSCASTQAKNAAAPYMG